MNGVELHYADRGAGPPIVFVHGGLADYREWEPVAADLASRYRTVLYSRRYNFPNDNRLRDGHSAAVEADDLAALIRALGLAPAHVVGVSYGAYTALLLGLRHRDLVQSLVLAEPPLVRWLPDLPGGKPVYDEFMSRLWTPAGRSFKAGDTAGALRVTLDYFVGPEAADSIPEAFRAAAPVQHPRMGRRSRRRRTRSRRVERSEVGRLDVPVLVLTGENTYPIAKIVDPELARLLPAGRREIIAGGTHDMCTEKPAACAAAIGGFLADELTARSRPRLRGGSKNGSLATVTPTRLRSWLTVNSMSSFVPGAQDFDSSVASAIILFNVGDQVLLVALPTCDAAAKDGDGDAGRGDGQLRGQPGLVVQALQVVPVDVQPHELADRTRRRLAAQGLLADERRLLEIDQLPEPDLERRVLLRRDDRLAGADVVDVEEDQAGLDAGDVEGEHPRRRDVVRPSRGHERVPHREARARPPPRSRTRGRRCTRCARSPPALRRCARTRRGST